MVHYFGHGSHDTLNFQRDADGVDALKFTEEDNIPVLPWHPHRGIVVLHSCRGAAFEDYFSDKQVRSQDCIAKRISVYQKSRCLGQVVYANFCQLPFKHTVSSDPDTIYPPLTDEEKEQGMRYRPDRYVNKVQALLGADGVLWGYALLTGETGHKIANNKIKYDKAMKGEEDPLYPIYPIYSEVAKLSKRNQILPCRVFNKGGWSLSGLLRWAYLTQMIWNISNEKKIYCNLFIGVTFSH